MQQRIQEMERLKRLRERLDSERQTVAREMEAAMLDLEIAVIESDVRKAVANRAILLMEMWRKNGVFDVVASDGRRMRGNPVVTGNPVQDFWNVRNEVHRLANWSYGTHVALIG